MDRPGYPLRLDLQAPLEVENWRPLVHWLLVIPQLLIVSALRAVRGVLLLIAFFAVLFTERFPRGLFDDDAPVSLAGEHLRPLDADELPALRLLPPIGRPG